MPDMSTIRTKITSAEDDTEDDNKIDSLSTYERIQNYNLSKWKELRKTRQNTGLEWTYMCEEKLIYILKEKGWMYNALEAK